jgi:AcrR family transcriptional regulator
MNRDAGKSRQCPSEHKASSAQTDAKRDVILASASDYFAEKGFEGSTRDLARNIGVSQSLLYHYFSQKDDLTTSVYNRLYSSRWRSEWDEIFMDPELDGREKIKRFYISYYRNVLKRPWTRIFMFGALKGLDIHRKNFDVVREKIFPLVIAELRGDRRALTLPDLTDVELELAWNLHSSIFYLAVRRWILRLKGRLGVEESIRFAIDVFLDGALRTLCSRTESMK